MKFVVVLRHQAYGTFRSLGAAEGWARNDDGCSR